MPTDALVNVPDGVDLFLDANIFIYAFTKRSPQCVDLLARCSRQDVFGITSHESINEITHRLMVHEAFEKNLIGKPTADKLREKPAVIRDLSNYWVQASQVFSMNLTILGTEEAVLYRAQQVRVIYGLMTLDSVIVATMEEYGIDRIASLDTDFERVSALTVYQPTDIP